MKLQLAQADTSLPVAKRVLPSTRLGTEIGGKVEKEQGQKPPRFCGGAAAGFLVVHGSSWGGLGWVGVLVDLARGLSGSGIHGKLQPLKEEAPDQYRSMQRGPSALGSLALGRR